MATDFFVLDGERATWTWSAVVAQTELCQRMTERSVRIDAEHSVRRFGVTKAVLWVLRSVASRRAARAIEVRDAMKEACFAAYGRPHVVTDEDLTSPITAKTA